jgi:HK97 family phage major capsid protein
MSFQIKKLKEEIGSARKGIQNLRSEKKDLLGKIDSLDESLSEGEWDSKFNALKNKLSRTETKIESKESIIENNFKELKELTGDTTIANNLTDIPHLATHKNGNNGRALDSGGSVKLYSPGESMAEDHKAPKDVDLGAYLRAVVDGPRNNVEREVLQNSISSDDYELPTWIASQLIDKLRAQNPLLKDDGAGARTLQLQGGDTKFIKTTGDPDAVWHKELTEETPDDPSFEPVIMKPKTVLSLTEVSKETIQDAQNIEEALTASFIGSINNAILEATFTGSGANTPTGLASTVTQTETYKKGGSPDWSNFVNASKTLYDNNVPEANRSFVFAPNIWQALALTQDDNSRYQDAPSFIRNIPRFTSSGLNSGVAYVGDFSNVVYGIRLDITIERFGGGTAAKKYSNVFVTAMRLDIGCFRPSALVRVEEASS